MTIKIDTKLINLKFEHAMKIKKGEILIGSPEDKEYRRRIKELSLTLQHPTP